MNLLGNGVKFTAEGEVNLTITPEYKSDESVKLLFEVTDSGIGIRQDKLDKIFSAFSQADDSTTRKFGGTGLGLVICEQLVRLQGGKIGVESELDKGSTFWFTVDYKIEKNFALTALEHPIYSDERPGTLPEPGKHQIFEAHILVAEDNLTNQMVTRGMLEKLGCRVDIVENGLQAVMAVKKNTYDLIIMDCQMPRMDGYEASEKIRKNTTAYGDKHIPIIALTAHAIKGDQEQCLASGMDDYLSKPCSESQIEAVLKKWLPGKRMLAADTGAVEQGASIVETACHDSMIAGVPFGRAEDNQKRGMCVLVVEDNEINQNVAAAMLCSFGCSVHLVSNGKQAVEAVTEKTYDLIFMDCQMPVMDGFEATTAIRGLESTVDPNASNPYHRNDWECSGRGPGKMSFCGYG